MGAKPFGELVTETMLAAEPELMARLERAYPGETLERRAMMARDLNLAEVKVRTRFGASVYDNEDAVRTIAPQLLGRATYEQERATHLDRMVHRFDTGDQFE